MPIHDWSQVDSGTFHDFHQGWTIELRNALNRGLLPDGYFAMADQRVMGFEPDVIALQTTSSDPIAHSPGLLVAEHPPATKPIRRTETEANRYAQKANRIAIRHKNGRVVAIIEIVSPGNKDSRHAVRSFTNKVVDFLRQGVHVTMIDLFPRTQRDPNGLDELIWQDSTGETLEQLAPDNPLAATAWDAAEPLTIYREGLAIGAPLPAIPLFLEPGYYIPTPLEVSYQTAWDVLPTEIRKLLA
jgi:Protein of unknown function (DUF4058)